MFSKGNWKEEGYIIKVGEAFSHPEGEEYVIDVFDPSGQEATYFKIQYYSNHTSYGETLHVMDAQVYKGHRRKGIASSVYMKMEEMLGVKITQNMDEQTSLAQQFWSQSNRPFGK